MGHKILTTSGIKNKEEMDQMLINKKKGIYIGFDQDLWDAIASISYRLHIPFEEVVDRALKNGLIALLDKI